MQNTRLVDVRQALLEGKETGQICYRTDHHLTSYGNYLLYRAYQIAQGAPYLSRDAYEVASYDGFYGTTWSGSGYWFTQPDQVEVWDSGKMCIRDRAWKISISSGTGSGSWPACPGGCFER